MSQEILEGQKIELKRKKRYEEIEFDKLQLYFGEPYVIDLPNAVGSITLYQPSLGEIIEIGEKKFYSSLNIFITNTTEYRLPLWENDIDWNDLSDFNLFCMLYSGIDDDVAKILFHNIQFSNFQLYNNVDKNVVLYSEQDDIEINEDVYQHIHQYLQHAFNMFPEEKITKDENLKKMFIQKDRNELKNKEKSKKKDGNSIQPLISACVNHPGFKYKLREMKELGIYEFFDSVKRLQIYENSTAIMKGMYSGFVDGSHIKPEDYNFMKEI